MRTCIVVDDDPFWAIEMSHPLKAAGYDVLMASDGAQALDLARRHPAAQMALDIVLPDIDGIEVLQALRKVAPDMKVLAVSGGGRLGADFCLDLARRLGACGKLAKPFTRAQFLESWNSAQVA